MNRAIPFIALVLALAFGSLGVQAADPLPAFAVHITGTVQRTVGMTQTDVSKARIQAQNLTNGSLFAEFNVSPDDYTLVLSLEDYALEFLPNRASSGKPTVRIFMLGLKNAHALDAAAQSVPFQQDITSSPDAANTLFENCEGRFIGVFRLQPPLKDPAALIFAGVKGVAYVSGHDPSTVAPVPPVELRITTGKAFVQQP